MIKNSYIGFYFCKSDNGHDSSFDFSELVSYAKSLKSVTFAWCNSELSLSDTNWEASLIKEKIISRIVIAGEETGYVKSFFTNVMVSVGNSTENVVLAGLRGYGAFIQGDIERAKVILVCCIYGFPLETAVSTVEVSQNPDTVVISTGIACIKVYLEIAVSGNLAYIVEKMGTMVGHMTMFVKTFPTLNCAVCNLTPRLVQVGEHPDIEFLTKSC